MAAACSEWSQAGSWVDPGGGSWADSANWEGAAVPDGPGAVAGFGQADIGRPMLVTLDGSRTAGVLAFGDAVPSHDWFVRKGSAGGLTLDGGGEMPVISVANRTATIGVDISGSGGMRKTGAGVLVLSGDNKWAGPTVIEAGTLRLAAPPSFPATLRIMPLGDSITYGNHGTNAGYRGPLFSKLQPLVPGFQYVGTSTLFPGSLPEDQRSHDGRPSYNIQDIHNNLDGLDSTRFLLHGGTARDPNGGYWLTGGGGTGRLPMFPDVVLLMVGTNDLDLLPGADGRLRMLLEKLLTLRPGSHVLVAKITPVTVHDGEETYNTLLETVVETMRGEGWKVRLVDLNTGFPTNGLNPDGVHPNDIGFDWMADQWQEALAAAYSETGGASAGLPSASAVTVAAGATLDIGGSLAAVGSIAAYGTVDLGDNAVVATAGLVLVNGATLDGSGTIYGTVIHNGKGIGGAGRHVTFNGSFVNNGTLSLPPGGSVTFNGPVTNNGVMAGGGGDTLIFNGNVTNNGTVRLTGGAALQAGAGFTNNGLLDLLTGAPGLPAGFVNLGSVIDASSFPKASAEMVDGRFAVRVDSHSGHIYQLQRNHDPFAGEWMDEGPPQSGNTGTRLRFSPPMNASRAFFRIAVDP